jgi:hypothetical protein
LKLAVTPEGMPLAESEIEPSNPPEVVEVMVDVPLAPCWTETEVGLAVRVKAGVAPATVSEMVVEAVSPPPFPVTVIV